MKRVLLFLAFAASAAGCGTYDPCESKTCGDTCFVCEPGDGNCEETGELKVCNSDLICTSAVPARCGTR